MLNESLTPEHNLLSDILHKASSQRAGSIAVIESGISYTVEQLADQAQTFADELHQLGLTRGDRIAICLPNSWAACVSIFGTFLAGGVLVPVSATTPVPKLEFTLDDSGARFLVTDTALLLDSIDHVKEKPGLTVMEKPIAGAVARSSWRNIQETGVSGIWAARPPVMPEDLAALIYTSGSTGRPKGVMLSHRNMSFALASVSAYLGIDSRDQIYSNLPFAHSYGLYQLLMAVATGAALIIGGGVSYMPPLVEELAGHRATVLPGVPTLFARLISFAEETGLVLPSVRIVTNAAAALPDVFVGPMQRLFPNAAIFRMYGMTECKRISYLDPALLGAKPGCVGKAIPGTEAYVADESGRPLKAGEIGILRVRGPHVMLGYWNQPDASREHLQPGSAPGEFVLVTGDYFRADTEGYLYFQGRSQDILKVHGEKVSALEVENVINAIPGVKEAAVIGVDIDNFDQVLRAFVVLKGDVALSAAQIKRACSQQLERFMVPRDVVFLSELPTTESGKVRKASLRTL